VQQQRQQRRLAVQQAKGYQPMHREVLMQQRVLMLRSKVQQNQQREPWQQPQHPLPVQKAVLFVPQGTPPRCIPEWCAVRHQP
jgi:hypothetical protein